MLRRGIDSLATKIIGLGGISIIVAVSLIFVFLFAEVVPMFTPAKIEQAAQLQFEDSATVLAADLDDRGELLVRIIDQADKPVQVQVRALSKSSEAKQVQSISLPFSSPEQFVYDSQAGWFAAKAQDQVHIGLLEEVETYKDSRRNVSFTLKMITPKTGAELREADSKTQIKLKQVKAHGKSIALTYTAQSITDTAQNAPIYLQLWTKKPSFLNKNPDYKIAKSYKISSPELAQDLYLGGRLDWLYAVTEQGVRVFRLGKNANDVTDYGLTKIEGLSASAMLLGSRSLLLGDSKGNISQWTLTKADGAKRLSLTKLRSLKLQDAPIVEILPEDRRRGFYALDTQGVIGLFFTTSARKLAEFELPLPASDVAIVGSPRSNSLAALTDSQATVFDVRNEHPEVSFASIWQKVWYEGYDQGEYIWQSSAATNEFEPKLSLTPLAYGTLKATFYAMLFALPLAICGAIYTAYFMAPIVRKKVKPTIEFMEALPTVILGFLAGIWLAPLVEMYLPGVLLTIFSLPVAMLLISLCWFKAPRGLRHRLPDGWEPLLLLPLIVIWVGICFYFSMPIEQWLFDGNARIWMRDTLGISYDQRNSLVVGIAMGFAVIPTIFSIAEDAVFAVPKSLSFGSLALGASPWQTLMRVVLPTASPGIFSAVMIGTGRAVGETMIVLMATGSTAIMDMNIFEGFRTLSANIAIEMPEAEVHSTHYRLLFFAALCLFIFTFVFNTTAEIVRQRLREKYGSL